MREALSLLRRLLVLFLWMLVGLVIGMLAILFVDGIYELLFKLMPNAFPLYNSVLQESEYEKLRSILDLTALCVTVLFTVYLSLRYDNPREERVIARTDGLFKVGKQLPVYVKENLPEDTVCCAVICAAFTVPFIFIPQKFLEMNNILSAMLNLFYVISDRFGLTVFGIILLSLLLIAHVVCAVPALCYWRAKWLSGFGEVR